MINKEIKQCEFGSNKIDCHIVYISDEDYTLCEKTSENYWANSKKGVYGKGLANTKSDKCLVTRVGLLGEMAVSSILGLEIDTQYRVGGDRYDYTYNGMTIDVKCATRNYGMNLIYYQNEFGKKIKIDKDIYILSFLKSEDKNNKFAIVNVVGFVYNKDLDSCEIKLGRKSGSKHYNIEVPFSMARNIKELNDSKSLRVQ